MLRSRLRLPRRPPPAAFASASLTPLHARRRLHLVPELRHDFSNGIPDLLSPEGFKFAWTDQMAFTIDKLNYLVQGTELQDRDPKSVALLTARDPGKAPIFNYASMAHNCHFFFEGLSPEPTKMPTELEEVLKTSFSSVETLRREFVISASVMFGPGFIWLVRTHGGNYRVLITYLAGSPYSGAHWRQQSYDMNTVGKDGTAEFYYKPQNSLFKGSGDKPPGGIDVQPLLCLNVWEHAFLCDWGCGVGGTGGKLAYAEAWWDRIDWPRVAQLAHVSKPQFK